MDVMYVNENERLIRTNFKYNSGENIFVMVTKTDENQFNLSDDKDYMAEMGVVPKEELKFICRKYRMRFTDNTFIKEYKANTEEDLKQAVSEFSRILLEITNSKYDN